MPLNQRLHSKTVLYREAGGEVSGKTQKTKSMGKRWETEIESLHVNNVHVVHENEDPSRNPPPSSLFSQTNMKDTNNKLASFFEI